MIVANKMDLRERTLVQRAQGVQLAEHLRMPFFETSALEGKDIDKPFTDLALQIRRAEGEGEGGEDL